MTNRTIQGVGLLAGAAMLFAASWVAGSPVAPFAEKNGFRQLALDPFGRASHSIRCTAKESTRVIVYGQGSTPLALYVYDAHGNCVARDDVSVGDVSDDLALEWFSPHEATYEVEVRNMGRRVNASEIAIR